MFLYESKKLVDTWYLISEFLHGANAKQRFVKFDDGGVWTNLKVLKIIANQLEEGNHLLLIDIGTCGLYTVHRNLQNELFCSGWKIKYILKWVWNFLKDRPARREVYEKFTKANVYPLPYCKTEQTAKRAAEIWPYYQKFVEHVILLKARQPENNKSYVGVVSVVSDLLLCAKFIFVEMLSWIFNKFLRGFWTGNPFST